MDQQTIDLALALRPARPEDATACAAIVGGWIEATDWMPRPHAPDALLRHLGHTVLPSRAVTVAERAGTVVGFVAVAGGAIDGLYVAEPARRHGVGAALLAAAKRANLAGLLLWTHVANREARAFYARQGFLELRRATADPDGAPPELLLAWPGTQ